MYAYVYIYIYIRLLRCIDIVVMHLLLRLFNHIQSMEKHLQCNDPVTKHLDDIYNHSLTWNRNKNAVAAITHLHGDAMV